MTISTTTLLNDGQYGHRNSLSMVAKKDEEDQSCNSVDTHEAFMDMLGLTHCDDIGDVDNFQEELILNDDTKNNDTIDEDCHLSSCHLLEDITYETINLPPRCSRHLLPPTSCLALLIDNVLTEQQCQYLIQKASTSPGGFKYITEATHKAPDGSSYTVQIQNPNPHQLAVLDTSHNPCGKKCKKIETHEDLQATRIMDHIYATISKVLDQSNVLYKNFVSRTKCGMHQGLNPRMRILKYDAVHNDRFEAHFDATTFVANTDDTETTRQQSLITVLVYLNNGDGEDFEGGETIFLDYHNSFTKSTGLNTEKNNVKITPKVGRVVVFEHDLFHSGAPLQKGTKFIMRTDVLFEEQCNNEQYPLYNDKQIIPSNVDSLPTSSKQVELVIDMCKEMQVTENVIQVLSEMDLLNVTIDAFMSAGVTFLRNMLVDAGLHHEVATSLIQRAISLKK